MDTGSYQLTQKEQVEVNPKSWKRIFNIRMNVEVIE